MFLTRAAKGGIPRGLARSGPAILSYGFRPFFLLAGLWAVLAMALWIVTLTTGLSLGGSIGPVDWHAHEMVFGYTSAVLAGFMLTAIPNWTGRLPVSGLPLLVLVLVWLMGRLAMLSPGGSWTGVALTVEALFLPMLTLVAMREIIAGRNWKNLKILLGLAVLSTANIWFQAEAYAGGDTSFAIRLGIAAWAVLIALVGGRIIPSFTRNWLSRQGVTSLPTPFGRFDKIAVGALAIALGWWVIAPTGVPTAAACLTASFLHVIRLLRWKGYATVREPIVLVMHISYLFLVVGTAMIAGAALHIFQGAAALHVILIGAIGGMTLAVMTRASLGHTGRSIKAGALANMAYAYVFLSAAMRPLAGALPHHYYTIFALSGLLWILAFAAFTAGYATILCTHRTAKGH